VLLEERAGFVALRISGRGAKKLVETEPGGHRWQRIPPNEKRGRVHTSTVTVAVLPEPAPNEVMLDLRDVRIDVYKGSGAGGQHRNKTETCIRATHLPTGIVARSESERSKHQNQELALAALAAKIKDAKSRALREERERSRRQQVGSGQRGDKVRTVRMQDGVVTCERTGRKQRAKDYLRGDLDWLA
jgi:peptide chain release factor 1